MENTKTLRQKLARGLTALIVPIVAGCATSTSDYLGALSWKTYSGMAKRPGTRIMSGLIGETMAFEAQKEAMKEAAREGVDYERRTQPNKSQQEVEKLIYPFMCNDWEDYNDNAIPETSEMSGIKSSFKRDEQITTGIYLRNMKGSLISYRLIHPNGKVEEKILRSVNYFHEWARTRNLPYEFNKLGRYKKEWFVDGKLSASQIFEIIE